jgi:hypothetical protein
MPIIPRYQPQGGPSVGGLNYADSYSPPDGSDWRILAQAAKAAGTVVDAAGGMFGGGDQSSAPEQEQGSGRRSHRSGPSRPQATRRAGDGPSDDKPARTERTGLGGAIGAMFSGIGSAFVAAGSSLADATALDNLSKAGGAVGPEAASKVISQAYQPAIGAARTPQERLALETNRNSLIGFWTELDANQQAAQAEAAHEALVDQTLQVGLGTIQTAPTYEAVEILGERQLTFGDVTVRDAGGDPAASQGRRLEQARTLRAAMERRKAELDPGRYLALTGHEGLSAALGRTQYQVSDDQIRGEAEAIGRPDLLTLSPEAFAIQAREGETPVLALESRYDRALQHFGGDQTLALAGLLAGSETVDGWLASIGDPRTGAISYADFRKAIPDAEVRDRMAVVETSLFGSVSGLLTPQARAEVRRYAQERLDIEDQDLDRQLVADADSGKVDAAQIQQAIADERLDPRRPAVQRAIAAAGRREKRESERRDDAALMARVRGPEKLDLDLSNPVHRRALDRDYAAFRARNPKAPFNQLVMAYAGEIGQLPTAANDELNRMLLSSDPKLLGEAAELFMRFEEADSLYLNGVSRQARLRGGYLRDRWKGGESTAAAVAQLRARDSMGEAEVAQRNRWYEKSMQEDPRRVERVLRQELFADQEVQAFKSLPGTLRQYTPFRGARYGAIYVPPGMMSDLNNIARSRYRDHLDPDRAHREAYDDVRKRWQPSYINGEPEFMRMPPDRIFAIDGEKPDKAARWQRIQAGWRFKIPQSDRIRFREPPSVTNRGKVVYQIWIADGNGRETRVTDWKTGRPAEWTPDVAGESAHRRREAHRWNEATKAYEDKKAYRRRWRARYRGAPMLRTH